MTVLFNDFIKQYEWRVSFKSTFLIEHLQAAASVKIHKVQR